MTVYNGMPYLMESLRSLFGQEDADFTLLVLNNGSSDGTRAWLDECAEKRGDGLPRFVIRHLPENIGRSHVLNTGLALVDSEITVILDADDLAAPGRIARQRAFFAKHPEIDLLGSDIIYIDGAGSRIGEERFPSSHAELRDNLPLFNQFAHSACAFRTAAARNAGGYDPRFPYAQDLALWVSMMRSGSLSASLGETLASIRVHPGQATRDLSLLLVRAKDNHRLAEGMLSIPGMAGASRQAAMVRSGLALWRLKKRGAGVYRIWQAVARAPLGFALNPLLWRRLRLSLGKAVKRLIAIQQF
jgi:glycosyltransferase involved in cell wall biosynthesis